MIAALRRVSNARTPDARTPHNARDLAEAARAARERAAQDVTANVRWAGWAGSETGTASAGVLAEASDLSQRTSQWLVSFNQSLAGMQAAEEIGERR
jgi:hypothetical protein